MKKLLAQLTSVAFVICISTSAFAQTAGTLTFTYTEVAKTASSCYNFSNTQHTFALWIQSNSGTFVKTKIRNWGGITTDHLPTWNSNSGGNTVSATTGATKASFGSGTVTWDGTDVTGLQVADGIYKVSIEQCWNHGASFITVTSYTFTKGPTADHQLPANTANISGVKLDWVPTTSSLNDAASSINPLLSVYPNPTEGVFNVDFKNATNFKVLNSLGAILYEEKIEQLTSGTKSIDLSNFTNGIYFINVSNGTNSSNHKIILNK